MKLDTRRKLKQEGRVLQPKGNTSNSPADGAHSLILAYCPETPIAKVLVHFFNGVALKFSIGYERQCSLILEIIKGIEDFHDSSNEEKCHSVHSAQ